MDTAKIAEMIIRLVPGAEIDADHAASGTIYLTAFHNEKSATCRISDHAADDSPYHVRQLARTGRAADIEIDPHHETSATIAAGQLADMLGLPISPVVKAARTRRANEAARRDAVRAASVAARLADEHSRRKRAAAASTDCWAYLAALAACEAYRRSTALENKAARKRARHWPARVNYAVGGIDQGAIFSAAYKKP